MCLNYVRPPGCRLAKRLEFILLSEASNQAKHKPKSCYDVTEHDGSTFWLSRADPAVTQPISMLAHGWISVGHLTISQC